jgi:hypothetical protein
MLSHHLIKGEFKAKAILAENAYIGGQRAKIENAQRIVPDVDVRFGREEFWKAGYDGKPIMDVIPAEWRWDA